MHYLLLNTALHNSSHFYSLNNRLPFARYFCLTKFSYAKELKDNAKEECEAGNFDGAKKKLSVAKDQVESFASMVEITRRISAVDKASFLADLAEIKGLIDELIGTL